MARSKKAAKLSRPKGPLSKGGEIVVEEELPFSVVYYPEYRASPYFAFAETATSRPYLCECAVEPLENEAGIYGLASAWDLIALSLDQNGIHRGSGVYPGVPAKLRALIQRRGRFLFSLKKFTKPGLCHACNQKIPSLMSSHYEHADMVFAWLYWYWYQECWRLGFSPTDGLFNRTNTEWTKSKINMRVKERFGLEALGGSSHAEHVVLKMVRELLPGEVVEQKVRPAWLERLELDIWIPSLNIGIEYQGQQHYQAVEHWGGQAALVGVQARDERKRKLCLDNGVRLIEIKYSDEVTHDTLRKVLGI